MIWAIQYFNNLVVASGCHSGCWWESMFLSLMLSLLGLKAKKTVFFSLLQKHHNLFRFEFGNPGKSHCHLSFYNCNHHLALTLEVLAAVQYSPPYKWAAPFCRISELAAEHSIYLLIFKLKACLKDKGLFIVFFSWNFELCSYSCVSEWLGS